MDALFFSLETYATLYRVGVVLKRKKRGLFIALYDRVWPNDHAPLQYGLVVFDFFNQTQQMFD